jgi:hypothetical protein
MLSLPYRHTHIVLLATETNKFELLNYLPTEGTTSPINTPFQQTFQMEQMPAVSLYFVKTIQTNRTNLFLPPIFLVILLPVILDRQNNLHRFCL